MPKHASAGKSKVLQQLSKTTHTSHSPQHTTLPTINTNTLHIAWLFTILPTLHHTLHTPHKNLKPHCQRSNPGWWQSFLGANSWKTVALLRTAFSSSANYTSSTLPGQANLYSDSLSQNCQLEEQLDNTEAQIQEFGVRVCCDLCECCIVSCYMMVRYLEATEESSTV